MSAPINLNKARKARAKAEQKAQADENSVRFGRPKAQRRQDDHAKAKAIKEIDDHKRTP